MRTQLLVVILLLGGCSSTEPKSPDNITELNNAASDAANAQTDTRNNAAADAPMIVDAGAAPDLSPLPAYCETVSSQGFFSDCSACDANGLDCDTIDAPSASGRACGCSSGSCPCGLRCGSYEVAPGITVAGICIR